MNFELTPQQRLSLKTARDFAAAELEPFAGHLDDTAAFPAEAIKKLGALGFMGITIPKAFGGCGLDTVSYCLIIEQLAKACASTAIIVAVHNSVVAYPVFLLGTEAQKNRYLFDLAGGRKLGAFALTEPNAGSDPASIETTAEQTANGYELNGTKTFITSGQTSDVVIVMASTDRSKKGRGITAFIVDKGTAGFKVGKKEEKLGIRASDTCELIFEKCEIPPENRLGGEGEGLSSALMALSLGRIGVAAQALGVGMSAMEASVQYSRQRKQFGRPIADLQAVQWMIADMAVKLESARLLTLQAAFLKDAGKPFTREASMAKLFASEAAMDTATRAVQIHGGYGCMKDYRVERCFRDAKVIEIYEGTSEIQRLIVARDVLKGRG